jgi:hypothetical protein
VLTWNGILIDGHNRYEICTKHGLAFSVVEKEFASESNVKEWMINNQFGRRNLSNYQRSVLALELESVFSDRAKEQQIRKPESVKQISAEQKPIETRKELAKIANVSHDTIAKVKKPLDCGFFLSLLIIHSRGLLLSFGGIFRGIF